MTKAANLSALGSNVTTAGNISSESTLTLQTNSTTAVTIDTSQNVGIGTTSPSQKLQVSDGGDSGDVRIQLGNTRKLELIRNATFDNWIRSSSTGADFYIDQNANANLIMRTNATEQMRIDSAGLLKFNSGYGSVATAYGCRAWVNFNGTGTPAIVESGNISSITDNGAGDYTLNFTTSMPDANYTAVFGQAAGSTASSNYVQGIHVTGASATGAATTKTTSALRILGRSTGGSSVDCVQNNVAIFR
jgi:hypothetical protein